MAPKRKQKAPDFSEDWQRYFDLYDFAPVPSIRLDRNGVIEEINRAGCQLLSGQQRTPVGGPLVMFIESFSRADFLEHMRQCRSTDLAVESALTFVSKEGLPIDARVYSKRSQLGNRAVYWTVLTNLTEHRLLDRAGTQAEWRRARAESGERLGRATDEATHQFLNILSHELRTPLTPALFAASRLLERDMPEQARRLGAIIKRNIQSEARLIDDLLDVSRIERGALSMVFAPVNLHEVVTQAIDACQPQLGSKPVTLSTALNASRHVVRGDAGRLRQVFSNLLTNAIKFTDSGRIEVRSTNSESGDVQVSISDTGVGLSPEDVRRLFVSFEQHRGQSSRGGLGLGLAICRGVIEAHGGRIWATSRGVGEGATFDVELSTVVEPVHLVVESPVRASNGSRRLRILIVEDDDETAAMLKDALTYEGHRLNVVRTVADARAHAHETWDVVISDLGLPDGSGFDVARQFTPTIPQPRLIVLSGYGSETDREASSAAGFERHLVKPIDLDQLRSALNP